MSMRVNLAYAALAISIASCSREPSVIMETTPYRFGSVQTMELEQTLPDTGVIYSDEIPSIPFSPPQIGLSTDPPPLESIDLEGTHVYYIKLVRHDNNICFGKSKVPYSPPKRNGFEKLEKLRAHEVMRRFNALVDSGKFTQVFLPRHYTKGKSIEINHEEGIISFYGIKKDSIPEPEEVLLETIPIDQLREFRRAHQQVVLGNTAA